MEINFRYSSPNKPVFMEMKEEHRKGEVPLGCKYIEQYRQLEAEVKITNSSKYAAQIRCPDKLRGSRRNQTPGRLGNNHRESMSETKTIQWEGGRGLTSLMASGCVPPPDSTFAGVYCSAADLAAIHVDIVADGFSPKHLRMPVTILSLKDYEGYSQLRAALIQQGSPAP